MTNGETSSRATTMIEAFKLRHSFVIRHSPFIIGAGAFVLFAAEARAS
jgi:hypothetical protein